MSSASPARAVAGRPPHSGGRDRESRWTPYLFIAPVALYLAVFQGYPLVSEFVLSFQQSSLLAPQDARFVGLRNYHDLASSSDFASVLWTTLIYTVACVVFAISLGLGAALLLDRPFRGRGLARALVTVPWAAPPVAVATIFAWMLNAQYGIFNHALKLLDLEIGYESWLDNPKLALPAILFTTVWQIFPFSSVVLLAALQGVSEEVREAAQIDGASTMTVYRRIIIPLMRPVFLSAFVVLAHLAIKAYDLVVALTGGGPGQATELPATFMYSYTFTRNQMGIGASSAIVMLAMIFSIIIPYLYSEIRGGKGR